MGHSKYEVQFWVRHETKQTPPADIFRVTTDLHCSSSGVIKSGTKVMFSNEWGGEKFESALTLKPGPKLDLKITGKHNASSALQQFDPFEGTTMIFDLSDADGKEKKANFEGWQSVAKYLVGEILLEEILLGEIRTGPCG